MLGSGYFKSLAAVLTRIIKPIMRLFGLKSPSLSAARPGRSVVLSGRLSNL
jgi:hypothetical protein